MLNLVVTSQFKKDYKKVRKQGKNIESLNQLMQKILRQEELPRKYKDHSLVGNFRGRRECHLTPDWLLIYRIDGEDAVFERTGSHSELLKL